MRYPGGVYKKCLGHFWELSASRCQDDMGMWQWLTFAHTKSSTNPSFHLGVAGFASNHSLALFYILGRKSLYKKKFLAVAALQPRRVSRAPGISCAPPARAGQVFLTRPPFSRRSNQRLGAALHQSLFWGQAVKILLGEKVLQNPHTSFKALTVMAVDTNEDSIVISII